MKDKIESYIGFALKNRSAVLGCDSIGTCRKKIYVLLHTPTLSQRSQQLVAAQAAKHNCPLVQVEDYPTLAARNCKALAICDKSLAEAIVAASKKQSED